MGRRHSYICAVLLLLSCNIFVASSRLVIRLRADTQCPMAGYFRDESDCRKFYRCAEHHTGVLGQKIITKAEFNYPGGTIYDEALSSCNHVSFVRDIPPGCDVSSAMGGAINVVDNTNNDNSISSSAIISSDNSSHSRSNSTSDNESMPSHPLQPFIPPSNLPPLQVIPGNQQNPLKPPPGAPEIPSLVPGVNPGEQPQFPALPGLMPGDQEQQPPPSIPGLPMPGDDGQLPPFPAIPGLPMPGGDGQMPCFPTVPGLPLPGNQQQLPGYIPSISVPVMQEGQLQAPSNPSLSVPNLPGGQQLPSTFPFNFKIFNANFQRPSLSPSNIPGITAISASSDNHSQNPQNNFQNFEQNISQNELSMNSQVAIAVPVQNQNTEVATAGAAASGWVNPHNFSKQPVSSSDADHQASPGWVVPNNFPTFYSYSILGSRTPILIAGQQVSQPPTSAYIII